MDYEKLYKKALERASKLRFQNPFDTVSQMMEHVFPELKESEDERIRKAIKQHFLYLDDSFPDKAKWLAWLEKQGQQDDYDDNIITRDDEILQAISIGLADAEKDLGWSDFGGLPIEEIQEWLEKQGDKSVNIDIESMVSSYKQRLKSQGGVENTPLVNMCLTAFRQGVENVLDELSLKKLEKQVEKKPASSEKTCKDDTLLDLLHKIPSCITVDGIDYHFVMKKTIAYMAFYEGEGEGSGKVIFWMAGDPIDLLTAMLEKLKKEGLLK